MPQAALTAHLVTVGSLIELDRVTRRGLSPSLPPGTQVRLTLLPDDQPERGSWERSLSRHATACGCQGASAALVFVMAALVAASVGGGFTVTVPNLSVAVSWVLFGISSVVLAKFVALYAAQRSLRKLGATIAAAANSAWRM